LTEVRRPIPDTQTLGGQEDYLHLAASPQYLLAAAHGFTMSWRPAGRQDIRRVFFYQQPVNIVEDVDLRGDRILLLGEGTSGSIRESRGGIAFLGTITPTGLKDYKPFLFDVKGAMVPSLDHCSGVGVGAVRFLSDGSYVVIPGFQPGAYLYDAGGKLVREWTAAETSLTTDCSSMTEAESDRLLSSIANGTAWLNDRRVLDDILPLPEGPGLLVRFQGPDRRIHWELRVLRAAGGIVTYPVPLVGERPLDRLHGDVRGSKAVLLKSSLYYIAMTPREQTGEIAVIDVPGSMGTH
jgi:hypothetical protein